MSLDSSFWLDAPGATPASAQALLLGTGFFEPLDDLQKRKRLSAPGCILTIAVPLPPQFTLADAGIAATLNLIFANSDKDDTKSWTLNTMRAVISLLHAYPGDALLLYSTGSPALLRKRGVLMLDERCGLWQPDVEPQVLSMVDLPYRFGVIPLD
jgi:hypothetical protein